MYAGDKSAWLWSFGNATFDESRWELKVNGERCEMEPKPLELLQYLLRHQGQVATRDELLSTVWAGRIVVDAVLTNAVVKLRKVLGDEAQEIIATVPRTGYRIQCEVTRVPAVGSPSSILLQPGSAVPRRPNWQLQELLNRSGSTEEWRGVHLRTGEQRAFKFSPDGAGLAELRDDVATLRETGSASNGQVNESILLDWDLDEAPFFIEKALSVVRRNKGEPSVPLPEPAHLAELGAHTEQPQARSKSRARWLLIAVGTAAVGVSLALMALN